MSRVGGGRRALLQLGGRSGLGFHELHGEPLYVHALRALVATAGPVLVAADEADRARVTRDAARWGLPVEVVGGAAWWEVVRRDAERGLLAHDVLCPLVTAEFLATVVERADAEPGTALVAVRPVTDTLKAVVDDRIEVTIDRERLVSVTSPVVVPPAVLVAARDAGEVPPLDDFAATVRWLRARGPVELVRAPSLGRRVENAGAVHLLESLDEVGHRVRAAAGRIASAAEDRP